MQYLLITSISKKIPGKKENEKIPCQIVRSDRRTMAVQVKEDGQVVIRIPRRMSVKQALEFAGKHGEWIRFHREKVLREKAKKPVYSQEEICCFKEKLRPLLEQRIAYYAGLMGVSYQRVCIRNQKTRWGSCSASGNLNFNWRLCLVPEKILDYVVVHELAHRREMNHSCRFWSIVEEILPDYRESRKWLREQGRELY